MQIKTKKKRSEKQINFLLSPWKLPENCAFKLERNFAITRTKGDEREERLWS